MEQRQHNVAPASRSQAQPRTAPRLVLVPQRASERELHVAVHGRMAALDGLRAASILIVLFAHAAQTAGAPRLLQPLGELGVFGVEVFFAISGFIITLLLIRERRRTGHIDLAAFWSRRAWRILPPFFAACIGLYAAAAVGLFNWSWSSFIGAATFTKNTQLFGGGWFSAISGASPWRSSSIWRGRSHSHGHARCIAQPWFWQRRSHLHL